VKGTILGPYEILGELASGGMATVYVARHTRLGHVVAIKVLHSQFQKDEQVRTRFVDEARIQANMGHPNILAVQDILELPEASGMVMELLAGCPLNEFYKRRQKPMPLPKVIKLFVALVEALAHAHAQGVVHRDLKPSNVFLHCVQQDVVPKLMDFGIAKLQSYGSGSPMTAAGSILGTPQYMAPEQFEDSSKVDARADIFALGVMLYEASVGERPFEGKTPAEIMRAVLTLPPTRPSEAADGFPGDLEEVIMICLRKDRERRFATAGALLEALLAVGKSIGLEDIPCADVPQRNLEDRGINLTTQIASSKMATLQERETRGGAPPRRTSRTKMERPARAGAADDSWVSTKWPKTHMLRKRSLGPFVVAALLALLVGAGIYVGSGMLGEEEPEVAHSERGGEQADAGRTLPGPDAAPQAPAPREEAAEKAGAEEKKQQEMRKSSLRDLPRLDGLQTGRWCEMAGGSLIVKVVNARLQAGWRGHRLSGLEEPELNQLGISVKEREDFRLVRKASTLVRDTDRLAIQGSVKQFKAGPLAKQDLKELQNRMAGSADLKSYVEWKSEYLCESLPLTSQGKDSGHLLEATLAKHSLDSGLFHRFETAYGTDRLVVSEISARAVCCLLNQGL